MIKQITIALLGNITNLLSTILLLVLCTRNNTGQPPRDISRYRFVNYGNTSILSHTARIIVRERNIHRKNLGSSWDSNQGLSGC